MEKFGIFELLDALAALTETGAPKRTESSEEEPAAKKVPDDAFRAPSYGGYEPAAKSENAPVETHAPQPQTEDAIDGFLARHEKIRRNVKK